MAVARARVAVACRARRCRMSDARLHLQAQSLVRRHVLVTRHETRATRGRCRVPKNEHPRPVQELPAGPAPARRGGRVGRRAGAAGRRAAAAAAAAAPPPPAERRAASRASAWQAAEPPRRAQLHHQVDQRHESSEAVHQPAGSIWSAGDSALPTETGVRCKRSTPTGADARFCLKSAPE